jgi:hypothetical protein
VRVRIWKLFLVIFSNNGLILNFTLSKYPVSGIIISVSLMSFLLIYLFNPRKNKTHIINAETKLLLYLLQV